MQVYRTREIQLKVDLIEGGGVTAENAEITLSPATIHVKGPADIIEAMDGEIVVGTVDLSAVPDSNEQELSFPLSLPAGVDNLISDEEQVSAQIRLSGVSTEKYTVSDVRVVNVASGYDTVCTKTVELTLRGNTKEIRQIKANNDSGFYVLVDLQDFSQPGAYTVPGQVVNEKHPGISVVEKVVNIAVIISQHVEQEATVNPEKE